MRSPVQLTYGRKEIVNINKLDSYSIPLQPGWTWLDFEQVFFQTENSMPIRIMCLLTNIVFLPLCAYICPIREHFYTYIDSVPSSYTNLAKDWFRGMGAQPGGINLRAS